MRWHALGVDYEMAGKDLISSVELSGKICRALGSRPPAGFIYELFLDENGEEDLEVARQRPRHRGVAHLRAARFALALHVQRAEARQAALLRRDSAPRRRPSDASREVPGAGGGRAAGKPGVAHSRGPPARARDRAQLRHPSQPRERLQHRGPGRALGLHCPLRARCLTGDRAHSRRAGRPRHRLLPRQGEAGEGPTARRWRRSGRRSTTCVPCSPRCRRTRAPRISRPRSTRWASATRSNRCASGSARSTRFSWAKARAPRMGSFIALYGLAETVALIDRALAGEDLAA